MKSRYKYSLFSGVACVAIVLFAIFVMYDTGGESNTIKGLLNQNNIYFDPENMVVAGGLIRDNGCGAVIDNDSKTHWFGIDSVSKPQKINIYSENPDPCKPNLRSCFCSAQTKLTRKTITELSYFNKTREAQVAEIVFNYTITGNKNLTPKFKIGKYNLDYVGNATGFCGEFWGESRSDYFKGEIENGSVVSMAVRRELPPLCAIKDDAKYHGELHADTR